MRRRSGFTKLFLRRISPPRSMRSSSVSNALRLLWEWRRRCLWEDGEVWGLSLIAPVSISLRRRREGSRNARDSSRRGEDLPGLWGKDMALLGGQVLVGRGNVSGGQLTHLDKSEDNVALEHRCFVSAALSPRTSPLRSGEMRESLGTDGKNLATRK